MKPAFLFFFLFLSGFVSAAPLDRNLGHDLAYHRIRELPADLPTDAIRSQPCVVDLRYVRPTPETVQDASLALAAWVKSHATTHTPVFILANATTSRVLLLRLAGRDPVGNVVVIGAAAPGFEPDIALKLSPEADRRAYDALEADTPIDSLVVETTNKPRNDEAQLAKERQPDAGSPDPVEAGPASAPAPADDKSAKSKPSSIDAVLQRAVQLHRTLIALKKL